MISTKRTHTVAWLTVSIAVCLAPIVVVAQFWPQWALVAQHTGQVGVAGQAMNRILANIVYDPLVPAEMAANGGDPSGVTTSAGGRPVSAWGSARRTDHSVGALSQTASPPRTILW